MPTKHVSLAYLVSGSYLFVFQHYAYESLQGLLYKVHLVRGLNPSTLSHRADNEVQTPKTTEIDFIISLSIYLSFYLQK